MRYETTRRRAAGLAVLVGLGLAACQDELEITRPGRPNPSSATGPAPEEVLLTIVDVPRFSMGDRQQGILSDIQDRGYTVETHFARVAANAGSLLQQGREIGIEVSPTEYYVAIVEEVEEHEPLEADEPVSLTVYGRLRNTFGTLRFTLNEHGVYGSLGDYTEKAFYDIEPLGNELVAVTRNDHTRFGDIDSSGYFSIMNHGGVCGHLPTLTQANNNDQMEFNQADYVSSDATVLAGSTIDLYMLRTTKVDSKVGTAINWQTRQAINQTFGNSVVAANVALVRSGPTGYSESGKTFDQMVEELANPSDGVLDGIHGNRNQSLADVVLLFVDRNVTTKGIACTIMAGAGTAFAVIEYDWAAAEGKLAGPHELGHLMGNWHHDVSNPTPFSYGRGYVHGTEGWRTIMAAGLQVRIPYFSNPNLSHPQTGTPLGISSRNAARALNHTRETVARFRRPLTVHIDGPRVVTGFEPCFWTAVTDGAIGGISSYQWSGSLSGTSRSIRGIIRNPGGGLIVDVEDGIGREARATLPIDVDSNAPPCQP